MAEQVSALTRELATYERLLPTISGDEGRFAAISGDELLGIFDTYADALTAGYQKFGLSPFLVKRISTIEFVSFFSRDLRYACHTSPM